jgi:dolichol-phosphate mannosyltransferase
VRIVAERDERRAYELAVVMPVHNEQDCIASVVRSWHNMLMTLGTEFVMITINDGSSDATGQVLQETANDRIRVIHQVNRGHGPTILRGYAEAVRLAEWVFQCDSDDEMPADSFPSLWQVRRQYEAVFGYRQARRQSAGRKFISLCSRATVRLAFGKGVRDVNTPYRLVRCDVLRPIIDRIPADTFAPNVIISGALARAGARICNLPVPHQPRRTGAVSIVKWKLWKAAFRSFEQALAFRLHFDGAELKGKLPAIGPVRSSS